MAKVAESVRARLFDLSASMKEFKHKFYPRFARLCSQPSELNEHFVPRESTWFNWRHGRRGTLWEERFKSVLLEDGNAVRTVAA